MDAERYSLLEWNSMPHCGGPTPDGTSALFTDGFGTFAYGFLTGNGFYIQNADGTNSHGDVTKFKWWAYLENYAGFADPNEKRPENKTASRA